MIFIQPLEITSEDGPTGKYRLCRWSVEDSTLKPTGLCRHEHTSPDEASACLDARRNIPDEPQPPKAANERNFIAPALKSPGKLLDRLAPPSRRRIEEELDSIQRALLDASTSDEAYRQLYVAQQALSWVLNPAIAAPPFSVISGGKVQPLRRDIPAN